MKDLIQPCISDLVFKRKIQVCLEKSSTIVKKYLCSSTEVMANGPQIFICNKSKNLLLEEVLTGNEILFYLASGIFDKNHHVLLKIYLKFVDNTNSLSLDK